MGGHLGVVSPAMKAYGQKAETAGGKISGVDLSGAAGQIGAALPGGTAGGAASGCALNQDVPNWGKAIAKQGGARLPAPTVLTARTRVASKACSGSSWAGAADG